MYRAVRFTRGSGLQQIIDRSAAGQHATAAQLAARCPINSHIKRFELCPPESLNLETQSSISRSEPW